MTVCVFLLIWYAGWQKCQSLYKNNGKTSFERPIIPKQKVIDIMD